MEARRSGRPARKYRISSFSIRRSLPLTRMLCVAPVVSSALDHHISLPSISSIVLASGRAPLDAISKIRSVFAVIALRKTISWSMSAMTDWNSVRTARRNSSSSARSRRPETHSYRAMAAKTPTMTTTSSRIVRDHSKSASRPLTVRGMVSGLEGHVQVADALVALIVLGPDDEVAHVGEREPAVLLELLPVAVREEDDAAQ